MRNSLLLILLTLSLCACAQRTSPLTPDSISFRMDMRHQRPSIYELVDQVRDSLSLSHEQFEKVYAAYEKFNNEVFGRTPQFAGMSGRPRMGRGGMKGSGMGRPGGMKRPNEMMKGGKNGNIPEGKNMADRKKPEIDWEKVAEKREKQEDKLIKSMEKLLGKDTPAFIKWQEIRTEQLLRIFPSVKENTDETDE